MITNKTLRTVLTMIPSERRSVHPFRCADLLDWLCAGSFLARVGEEYAAAYAKGTIESSREICRIIRNALKNAAKAKHEITEVLPLRRPWAGSAKTNDDSGRYIYRGPGKALRQLDARLGELVEGYQLTVISPYWTNDIVARDKDGQVVAVVLPRRMEESEVAEAKKST